MKTTKKPALRFAFRVTHTMKSRMKKAAKGEGKPVAQLVRDAIMAAMKRRQAGGPAPRGDTPSAMVRGMVEDHLEALGA